MKYMAIKIQYYEMWWVILFCIYEGFNTIKSLSKTTMSNVKTFIIRHWKQDKKMFNRHLNSINCDKSLQKHVISKITHIAYANTSILSCLNEFCLSTLSELLWNDSI